MKNGAAPGWDGLPNDFFQILAGYDTVTKKMRILRNQA